MKYRYRDASEMKDSGVEWLGDIPKDWQVSRLKYLADIDTGNKDTQDKEENGIYPFFVRSDTVERSNTYSFNGEAILTAGDGVGVAKVFHYINGKFAYHQRVYKISDFKDIKGKYVYYYIKDNLVKEVDKISAKTTVDSLRLPMFLNFPVLINKDGGEKIADFLDKKTSQFDSIISKKEALIEKLEEAKKSLICEVVTGKVKVVKIEDGYELVKRNSDEMKDTGVDWLGEIPKDWEVKRIKYLFEIKKNIAGKLGYDILSVTQSGIKIKDITKNEGQLSMDYSKYQIVGIGDFVMNHMDLLTGFVDCSKYIGVTSPDYRVFRLLNNSNNSDYYNYIFQFCYYNKIFYSLGQGVSSMGRWRLQTETFKNFILPKPSIVEQEHLARLLEIKIKDIEILKNKLKLNILKLKEAKQSLISEVVTGKIEILN